MSTGAAKFVIKYGVGGGGRLENILMSKFMMKTESRESCDLVKCDFKPL